MIDLLSFENGYSPLLSVLTGTFEVWVAIWAIRSPGRRRILWPLVASLLCLAGYQFLEVLVCANPEQLLWAKLAFADVAWLPAIGVWLLVQYAADDKPWAVWGGKIGLALAAGLVVLVFADPTFVTGTLCSTVIATYTNDWSYRLIYGGLYEVGLLTTVFGGIKAIVDMKDPVLKQHTADLVVGTLGFMLPSFITQLMLREIEPSMPSLMCHYALILAIMQWRTVKREREHALN